MKNLLLFTSLLFLGGMSYADHHAEACPADRAKACCAEKEACSADCDKACCAAKCEKEKACCADKAECAEKEACAEKSECAEK